MSAKLYRFALLGVLALGFQTQARFLAGLWLFAVAVGFLALWVACEMYLRRADLNAARTLTERLDDGPGIIAHVFDLLVLLLFFHRADISALQAWIGYLLLRPLCAWIIRQRSEWIWLTLSAGKAATPHHLRR